MPAGVLLVLIVKLEVIEPLTGGVTDAGAKEGVAPEGADWLQVVSPVPVHHLRERPTSELKPLIEVMVIVDGWEVPILGAPMGLTAEILKSAAGGLMLNATAGPIKLPAASLAEIFS